MKSIYIYGAGGHGYVIRDIAFACGYEEIIFVDDNDTNSLNFDEVDRKIPIIVGVGDNRTREKIFQKLQRSGMFLETLIHPSAIVSQSVEINPGTVIMPNVVVNAKTIIGKGCILNTSSVIEHENDIGDFVHISSNVSLAGNVTVSSYTMIGIASCVKQGISIGKESVIGAGSVVVKDIPEATVAYGNPCIERE